MTNDKRIKTICSMVSCPVVAEIGADHGYITKELFQQNKIKKAFLTDISSKCLQKALINFKSSNFFENCAFLVGDGLQALKDVEDKSSIGQVIIAGMGGLEIIKILKDEQANYYNQFVLQPQRKVVELRQFLQDNNYEILKDQMVREGKIYYNVLKVKKVDKQVLLTKNEILFGKTNLTEENSDFVDFLKFEIAQTTQILSVKSLPEKLEYLKNLQNVLTNKTKGV